MNPADQIDAITRRATDAVLAAAHGYSARRRELVEQSVVEGRAAADAPEPARTAAQAGVLRDRLTRAAELSDSATPQILLPADVAAGSPHRGQPGSGGTGH